MITLSIISFTVGVALGQRFTVMVLMPASAVVLAFAIGTGITHTQTAWWIVLMAATVVTCLQVGYLVGIGVRHLLAAALPPFFSSRTSSKSPARHAAH